MFDLFLSKRLLFFQRMVIFCGWIIYQRLGHYLWQGMKPFPALGMRHPISPEHPCKCLIIKGSIWSQ